VNPLSIEKKVTETRQLPPQVGVNRKYKDYFQHILAIYNSLLYHVTNQEVPAVSSVRIQNECKKLGLSAAT